MTRFTQTAQSHRLALIAFAGAALALSAAAQGQWTWNATSGSWNDPNNWLPMSVPSSSGTATIGVAGTYSVSTSTNSDIGSLTINNPNVTFNIFNNQTFAMNGGASVLANSGTVVVNPSGIQNLTRIYFSGNTSITGAGRVTLNANINDAFTGRFEGGGQGVTVTQAASHTIDGAGVVYNHSLVNNGTVSANVLGRVLLCHTMNITNNANMLALGGGSLNIDSSTITQSASGVLSAGNGSTINIYNSTLNGGGILNTGGTVIVPSSVSTTFSGVTINGPVGVANNSNLNVGTNGLTINSTLTVNPAAIQNLTRLFVNSAGTTINGTGAIVLNANVNDIFTSRLEGSGGIAVNFGPALTIRGTGIIYNFSPTINWRVDADVAGRALGVDTCTVTNNGIMKASTGVLYFNNSTVNQATLGAVQSPTNGGMVQFIASTINGGQLSASGGGELRLPASQSSTLNGVTMVGPFNIDNNALLNIAPGVVSNNGTITVNRLAIQNLTRLFFPSPGSSIIGVGTIQLNANPNDLSSARIEATGGIPVTFGINQTIRGTGLIYNFAPTINGLVQSVSGTLGVDSCTVANNGTFDSASSILYFNSTTVNQSSGGKITSSTGPGHVEFVNSLIDGGMLTTGVGGELRVPASQSSTFRNLTNSAAFNVFNNANFNIGFPGMVNNGVITVNSPGIQNTTRVFVPTGGTVLSGSGAVTLNANANDMFTARVEATAGAAFTQTATHTINGAGAIYNHVLVNAGLVDANVPYATAGRYLYINSMTVNNTGTLRATGGGYLNIGGSTINNTGAGVITVAAGSTLGAFASSINGGSINTNAAGVSLVPSGQSLNLNGVTLTGPFSIQNNANLNIGGSGLVNNGALTVNSTGIQNTTQFIFTNTSPVTGTGTITLNANPNDPYTARLTTNTPGQANTLGSGQTLRGRGVVYNFKPRINGIIQPGVGTGSISFIQFDSSQTTLDSGATYDVELDTATTGDRIVGSGSMVVDGKLRVRYVGPFTASRGNSWFIINQAAGIAGRFSTLDLPTLAAGHWAVTYAPTRVQLSVACNPADICGVGATYDNGNVDIGPDGQLTIEDFLNFLSAFGDSTGCPGTAPCNPADICGVGATYDNGNVDIGPDGDLTIEDFLNFLSAFGDATGCP